MKSQDKKPSSVFAEMDRIALVDDNPVDNEYHTIVLRKAGFRGELLAFETGEEALKFFDGPDVPEVTLLLLDINLPGANGFEVAQALMSKATRLPQLLVVMLTSSPDPEDLARARAIPIVRDYLTKPLTLPSLIELGERHFGHG